MNNADQLDERLRGADPAVGIDRSPDGPTGQRIYYQALQRVDDLPIAPGLRRGVSRRPLTPNRVWRRALALGAILAVAAIALAVVPDVLSGGTPAYAIRQLPNGVIVIDWSMDSFAPNASAIASDLRGYGVDVQITTVPSSPSAVGQVMATFPGEGDSGPPQGLTIGEPGTPGAFTWTIDPTVFHSPVTLEVQVPAGAGEHYLVSNSVFWPGEALGGLQCALGEPLRAADVAARLSDLGLTAVWNVSRLVSSDPGGSTWQNAQVKEVPDGYIAEGYSLDDATVEFTVVSNRVALSQYQGGTPLSDVPCTPEQAAAWK